MTPFIVTITLLIFICFIQNNNSNNILALVFGITLTYFYRYSITKNYDLLNNTQHLLKYLLYGENLYILMYLIWLAIFHKTTYIFYIPLFFSAIAKLVWLFTPNDQLNLDFLEETSLFQTKTQIFVIGYSLLTIIYAGFPALIQVFLLILILKLKYSFHGKAQQAFKELHFVIDNIFKRTRIRSKYQKLVQIIGLMGQVHGGSKDIIY